MQKIPVAETIGRVYGLSFRHYLTVAGIVWFPVVVIIGVLLAFMRPFSERMSTVFAHMADGSGPPDLGSLNAWVWLFNIANIVILAMMASGITKEVLGQRTGPRFIYLQF